MAIPTRQNLWDIFKQNLKPLVTKSPFVSPTITKGIIDIGKKAVGIGEPGAGFVGKVLPTVEKMTQLVEQKQPQKLKKFADWWKEESEKQGWIMGKYTPEQVQYLKQYPERKQPLKMSWATRGVMWGGSDVIKRGIITPEEAKLFPVTEVGPAITGMQDVSRMSATQLVPIMKQQAKVYFQKQGINLSKVTPKQLQKNYFDLAHKLHPDKPLGSPEAFKELQMFYDVAKTNTTNLAKNPTIIEWFKSAFAKQVKPEIPKAITGKEITPTITPKVPVIPKPITTGIPKELQPLAKEAMKTGDKVIFDSPTYKGRQIEGKFIKDLGNGKSLIKTEMAGFAPYEYKIDNTNIYTQAKGVGEIKPIPLAQKGIVPAIEPEISPIPQYKEEYLGGIEKQIVKGIHKELLPIKPLGEVSYKDIRKLGVRKEIEQLGKVDISKLPSDSQEAIEAELEQFDLKLRTKKTLFQRDQLKSYVANLESEGIVSNVPDELIDIAERIPINQMTSEELDFIKQKVMGLVSQGRLKNQLIKIQRGRQIDEVANELLESLKGKLPPVTKELPITSQTFQAKRFESIRKLFRYSKVGFDRMDRIFETLDKYKTDGKWFSTFYDSIDTARNVELTSQNKMVEGFRDKLKELELDKTYWKPQQVAGIQMSSSEKIGIYLLSQNEQSLYHLTTGNRLTPEIIEDITKSLTKQEMELSDWFKGFFEEYSGQSINKVYEQINGFPLKLQENYIPIKLEWLADPLVKIPETFEESMTADDLFRLQAMRPTGLITKGFTKARATKAGQPIKTDITNLFLSHLNEIEHYKAFAPVIRDLQAISRNPDIKNALTKVLGKEGYQMIDKWLKDNAKNDPLRAVTVGEKLMQSLRVNGVAAISGVNITMGMKQFPSYFAGMAEVGELPAVQGLFKYVLKPSQTKELLKQYAPQLYSRSFEREIAEMAQLKSLEKRITGKMSAKEVFMLVARTFDRYAVGSLWQGGFDNYLSKHPGESPELAAKYATRAIRKTQPYWEIKDLPDFYRQGEPAKLLTVFTNQLNNYYNYLKHDIIGKTIAKKQGIGTAFKKFIETIVLSALIFNWIARSRPAKNVKEAVGDVGKQLIRMIPVIGQYITAGLDGWTNQTPVPLQGFQTIAQTSAYLGKGKLVKAIKPGLQTLGFFVGLPTYQTIRTTTGLLDLVQGKTDDWLRLIYSEYMREQAQTMNKIPKAQDILKKYGIETTNNVGAQSILDKYGIK